MRVSELITTDEIRKWNVGDIVLINAPTGAGKSYFVLNGLKYIADTKKQKILMFANRDILKKQMKRDIHNNNTVKIINYQELEHAILNNNYEYLAKLSQYDYIVCDEVHYFFNDSRFNKLTDLSLNWILNQEKRIRILMSATSDFLERYLKNYLELKIKKYEIPKNYNYIKNLYFFKDDKVIEKMLFELNENEKAIYFASAKKAYEMSIKLDNATFLCSVNNKKYSKYIDINTKEEIINNEKFDSQILCTTSVFDNGINIRDEQVKHIIIDYFDLNTIEQCIGRKRILNKKDIVNVYIKDYSIKIKTVLSIKNSLMKKIEYAKILINDGYENLIRKYPRANYGDMIYDEINENKQIEKKINKIMFFEYLDKINLCDKLLKQEKDFKELILKKLDNLTDSIQYLDDIYDVLKLEDKLDKLVGKKMFEREKEKFINFLRYELFNSIKSRYGSIKVSTINGFFKDNNIPYEIESQKENSRTKNRGKRYWIISKKIYDNKMIS